MYARAQMAASTKNAPAYILQTDQDISWRKNYGPKQFIASAIGNEARKWQFRMTKKMVAVVCRSGWLCCKRIATLRENCSTATFFEMHRDAASGRMGGEKKRWRDKKRKMKMIEKNSWKINFSCIRRAAMMRQWRKHVWCRKFVQNVSFSLRVIQIVRLENYDKTIIFLQCCAHFSTSTIRVNVCDVCFHVS